MPATAADLDDDAFDALVSRASERVDYRLTYDATDPRQPHAFGIYGPPIPNAYAPDQLSSGDWEDPDFATTVTTEQGAIDRWFTTAVREAVHESLEWFRVDGEVFLDPHGQHERAVHELSEQFAAALLALRTTPTGPHPAPSTP